MAIPTEGRADGYGSYRYPQRHTNGNPERAYQDGYDDGYSKGLEEGTAKQKEKEIEDYLTFDLDLEASDEACLRGYFNDYSPPPVKESTPETEKTNKSIFSVLSDKFIEFDKNLKVFYTEYCNLQIAKGVMPISYQEYLKLALAKKVSKEG